MSTVGSSDDQQWVDANRDVIEQAFKVFIDTGDWPKVTEIRRYFAQLGKIIDVARVVKERPRVPGELRPMYEDSLILRLRHLRYVPSAQPLVSVCLTATRRAIESYLGQDAEPKISSTDPQIAALAGGDHTLLIRAGALLQAEHPGPLSGGGYGPDHWQYWINDHTILDFRDVASPDAFVERQNEMLQLYATELSQAVAPAATSTAKQQRVFVLMPFSPAWSRTVYEMIKRALMTLPLSPLPAVCRADDITDPGRITDQIVAEINAANVIVADITELNSNVMWELGFAHALDKPVVILNQDIGTSPFDLLDHRQVGYARDPTPDDEARLAEFLRSAFGT